MIIHGVRVCAAGPVLFVAVLVLAACSEELLWDRANWHERQYLFGGPWSIAATIETALVPLLALPQVTLYVLDGFVWRRRGEAGVLKLVAARD